MFSLVKQSVAGLQILFVAFGAMVLVPLLTGLNPSMALLGAGVGTLLFQLCTRRQVPIFLGSSFACTALCGTLPAERKRRFSKGEAYAKTAVSSAGRGAS